MALALRQGSKPKRNLHGFRARTEINLDRNPYQLRIATSDAELEAAFQLRAEVFAEQSGLAIASGRDCDDFDLSCDHVLIFDTRADKLVGTYRVRSSLHNDDFYSQTEFHLQPLLRQNSNKMELGRAAVHRDYRNGSVISLLWRGIVSYALATKSQTLFGCSSVFTTDPQDAATIALWLERQGHGHNLENIAPTKKYIMPGFAGALSWAKAQAPEAIESRATALMPTLFEAYLKMGAKVALEPALDKEFACVDFLTVLDLERLSRLYRRFQS